MHKKVEQWSVITLALLDCVPASWADAPSKTAKLAENSARYQAYAVNMHGCPIELKSRVGGESGRDPMDARHGAFWHDDFAYKFTLSMQLDCYPEPAAQRCPEALDLREDDPSTLRLMQVAHYQKINSMYGSSAVAYTFTAVNPPRGRQLKFCLGDSQRAVVGYTIVGNERRAFTKEVLRIIATIRFTDEQRRKK